MDNNSLTCRKIKMLKTAKNGMYKRPKSNF